MSSPWTDLQPGHIPEEDDHILDQCPGVIGIADDFCIHRKDMQEHIASNS